MTRRRLWLLLLYAVQSADCAENLLGFAPGRQQAT